MGKSRIVLETEVLKFAALLCVGIAGGSLSLLLGELTLLKKVLAGGGFVATMVVVSFVWRKYHWLQIQADKEDAQ